MEKIIIELDRTDLASRALAVPVREKIASYIKANTNIVLDLGKVMSLSASYADELFGILTKNLGVQAVIEHLKIINVSEPVLESIAEAMQVRSTEHCQQAA